MRHYWRILKHCGWSFNSGSRLCLICYFHNNSYGKKVLIGDLALLLRRHRSSNNKRWSWSSALSSETPSLLVKGFLENKFSVQCLKGKCICHENDDNESEVLKSNCRRTSTTTEWVPITLSRKGNTLYYDDFIWQSSSFQRDFETPFKNSWHDTFQHFLCYTRVPFISKGVETFL